ncbi:MAG: sulfite exporter TauE/SafE family protein [Desulfobacterales bacterium]|nr:sulfite exporter TauE/SafE family protein [Desulfobacterales bacterium]
MKLTINISNNFHKRALNLLSFFVALFSAGIGIGGGTIFVSAFISVFKFDFKRAAGISLATIISITFVGAVSHLFFFSNPPPGKYFLVFIPSCIIGTIIGSKFIHKGNNQWLKWIFAIFLLIASLRILKLVDFPFLMFSSLSEISWIHEAIFIMAFGIITGIIATWLGIGCGLLIIPFFVIVMDFNVHEAICLSLTTMFFLTTSATLMHHKLANLDFKSFKALFLLSLVGAVTGSAISGLLPGFFLKQVFGIILIMIASTYLLQPIFRVIKINRETRKTLYKEI